MLENKDSLWHSAELYAIYISCSSRLLSRSIIIEKVKERLSDDVIVLTPPGYESIIAFNRCTSSVLKIRKDEDEDDELEHNKIKVARCILNVSARK